MRPAVITVAITGSVPRRKDTPALPVTPAEQIESTPHPSEMWVRVRA
jgi:3-keto-5-aminohexanoate cleavage enzyme